MPAGGYSDKIRSHITYWKVLNKINTSEFDYYQRKASYCMSSKIPPNLPVDASLVQQRGLRIPAAQTPQTELHLLPSSTVQLMAL